MSKKLNLEKVKDFIINSSPTTKIYIGCDSERYRSKGSWWADYAVAIVVHKDGDKGCKVFGEITKEKDFDRKLNRPALRLMNEVYKAAGTYLELADAIGDRHAEVHLDINPDIVHGSSCVIQQAIGYVRGVCNKTPKVKDEAFAASYAADRLKELI